MLHQSSTETGMGRMRMVDHLVVPAHGQVALAPGGYHFMLMDAGKPVRPGQNVQMTLRFVDGSTLTAGFLAKPANAL
jgi:copper(I)-binding protein